MNIAVIIAIFDGLTKFQNSKAIGFSKALEKNTDYRTVKSSTHET
jgi:hypothetical protein